MRAVYALGAVNEAVELFHPYAHPCLSLRAGRVPARRPQPVLRNQEGSFPLLPEKRGPALSSPNLRSRLSEIPSQCSAGSTISIGRRLGFFAGARPWARRTRRGGKFRTRRKGLRRNLAIISEDGLHISPQSV